MNPNSGSTNRQSVVEELVQELEKRGFDVYLLTDIGEVKKVSLEQLESIHFAPSLLPAVMEPFRCWQTCFRSKRRSQFYRLGLRIYLPNIWALPLIQSWLRR